MCSAKRHPPCYYRDYTLWFLSRPNWIKLYGEENHRSDFVHLGWQQNDLPEFGKLLDIIIIVIREFPFFLVEKYETVDINSHILGYLIWHSYFTSVPVSMLPYKTITAHSYIADRRLYIVPKSQFTILFMQGVHAFRMYN